MSSTTTPILIVGTGALACLFAAKLDSAGIPVTLLGSWAAGIRAIQEQGITLTEADGQTSTHFVSVTDQPMACAHICHALILVKAYQTGRVANQLASCLPSNGVALTLQNGLGNREQLVSQLGDERVAIGTVTVGATLTAPGQVRVGGTGVISLAPHARLGVVPASLEQAGFVVGIVADIAGILWGKLLFNAALNPLSALLRVPNGELLTRPAARPIWEAVVRETAQLAAAQGISLPYADPVAATEQVLQRVGANQSSMLQDLLHSRITEIEAISGEIVRIAARLQVPVPVNQLLYQLITALTDYQPSTANKI